MTEVRMPVDEFLNETERMLKTADARGVPLKVCGSVGTFLAAVPLGKLDRAYLARFYGNDWGLWYDSETNLAAVGMALDKRPAIAPDVRDLVQGRIVEYQRFLRDCPKTRRWEKRRARG